MVEPYNTISSPSTLLPQQRKLPLRLSPKIINYTTMSDFFRRASDAFHNRQRQDSTGSTGAPTSPDAAKSPEEPLNERSGSVQSESHVNEAFAGTATSICPISFYFLGSSRSRTRANKLG